MLYPIIYVQDQTASSNFYSKLLGVTPSLDVPGMTEFSKNAIPFLGIMPLIGLNKLLPNLQFSNNKQGSIPCCELYFAVSDVQQKLAESLELGAKLLSPAIPRDWGHVVAYIQDADGYIIALAQAQLRNGQW